MIGHQSLVIEESPKASITPDKCDHARHGRHVGMKACKEPLIKESFYMHAMRVAESYLQPYL